MNLKSLNVSLVALVGLGLLITMSAFTEVKVSTLKYRYNLSSETGINAVSNWTDVSSQSNPTGCDGNDIPCVVQFQSSEYANLTAFLAANPTAPDMEDSGKVISHKNIQ